MKPSLKQLLYQEVLDREFVGIDTLYEIARREGHKPDTMSRKMRELTEEGKVIPTFTVHKAINGYIIAGLAEHTPVPVDYNAPICPKVEFKSEKGNCGHQADLFS
jgi:hypothetical protein